MIFYQFDEENPYLLATLVCCSFTAPFLLTKYTIAALFLTCKMSRKGAAKEQPIAKMNSPR